MSVTDYSAVEKRRIKLLKILSLVQRFLCIIIIILAAIFLACSQIGLTENHKTDNPNSF